MKLHRTTNALNGRLTYYTGDGNYYAVKNTGWGWSVGEITNTGDSVHIEDVRTLNEARALIAKVNA